MAVGGAHAELKAIHTEKTKDVVITLKSEAGQWKQGRNTFVLEFTSPSGQPLDVGKVASQHRDAHAGYAADDRGGDAGSRQDTRPLHGDDQLPG